MIHLGLVRSRIGTKTIYSWATLYTSSSPKRKQLCSRNHWPLSAWVHQFSSVHFSPSVVPDSFWPHELQPTRPLCPSPTPRVHTNSRPWSRWCHPAISSSAVPFSFCPQSLLASESFPMSQLFAWGGQSTGVFSFSIVPSKESPGLISFGWISLQSKEL